MFDQSMVILRQRLANVFCFTDLPVNFPFDFEYVKEHLDPSQFRGQHERRQILHVPDVQLRPDLVGHVKRRLWYKWFIYIYICVCIHNIIYYY